MKEYLCKCNNCDSVMIDENPQVAAKKHEVADFVKQMILQDSYWACPICKTDSYLVDL